MQDFASVVLRINHTHMQPCPSSGVAATVCASVTVVTCDAACVHVVRVQGTGIVLSWQVGSHLPSCGMMYDPRSIMKCVAWGLF